MIDAVLAVEERRVILVDGFNVLHAVLLGEDRDSRWWRREHRERLLRRVRDWPGANDQIWVAFDGAKPSWSVWMEPVATVLPPRPASASSPSSLSKEEHPRGPIVHSVYVESADHWIVRRARRTDHPERTVIVTADRQVAGRARSAGCEIWTPRAFMSQCPSKEDGRDAVRELSTIEPSVGDPPS
jgi:predicted RNA-binding protein with PIN domain